MNETAHTTNRFQIPIMGQKIEQSNRDSEINVMNMTKEKKSETRRYRGRKDTKSSQNKIY